MSESRSLTSSFRDALTEGRRLGSWCNESPVEAMISAIRRKRSILCCVMAEHVLACALSSTESVPQRRHLSEDRAEVPVRIMAVVTYG